MEPLPLDGHLGGGEPMVKPTWPGSVFCFNGDKGLLEPKAGRQIDR